MSETNQPNDEERSQEAPDSENTEGIDPKRAFEMGAESSTPGPSPAQWSPPEPEVLDPLFPNYTIGELIGRGGMGAVYRGMQKSLDRTVAIKVLPPEMADADPSFSARFEREAKAMAGLDHPNIVHVHDFGRTEAGHWYIVMEYVDGKDFHLLIRSGEVKVPDALVAVSQICDALEYAHGMGYVHRDIKPENIFITKKGVLKVGDFGLAKLIDGEAGDDSSSGSGPTLTRTGMGMGTPAYCAPEQMDGQETDHRADIYSLGVMFYEMLTRELPRGNFPLPSQKVEMDVRIDDVVLRAMESERDRRYSSAGEMRTELETVQTTPPSNDLKTKNQETTMNTTVPTAAISNAPSADDSRHTNAKIFGLISLGVLVAGLLLPILIVIVFGIERIMPCIILYQFCLVISIIFGILGWKHATGKVSAIIAISLTLINLLLIVLVTPLTVKRSPHIEFNHVLPTSITVSKIT